MSRDVIWAPETLEEIRTKYANDRSITMTDLAEAYGTSPSTVHNIVHKRGRFNPKFAFAPARSPSYVLLDHSAMWYRETFIAQHEELDTDEVLEDPDSSLPRVRPATHRLSQPHDWYPITDVTGDERTAAALATMCNNLYYRMHRTEITRLKNIRRQEACMAAGMASKRNMAIAYLTEVYNLADEFFALIMNVTPASIRVWRRMGVGALVDF